MALLASGCAPRGEALRVVRGTGANVSNSYYIETKANAPGAKVSCSFVEFDDRGDFMKFTQHRDCQKTIRALSDEGRVMVVMYCHGWKNGAHSSDVVRFNAFLLRLAESVGVERGLRVHGVYLSWRASTVRHHVNSKSAEFEQTATAYGAPLVDISKTRRSRKLGIVRENLDYWRIKAAAEHRVSGLPLARSIFTYAHAAKDYGNKPDNPVLVFGHSFGALMLEQSLGQAMTGLVVQQWSNTPDGARVRRENTDLPFDMVLFANSAAPSIYAKEMRDFLAAHRRALRDDPGRDVPVIISVTSTADGATRGLHRIGNFLAPLSPSLRRKYSTGILVGGEDGEGEYPEHEKISQSEFYTRTPGHQPLLVNRWVVPDKTPVPAGRSHRQIFARNLAPSSSPDVFFTSEAKHPAAAWRLSKKSPGDEYVRDGKTPAMRDSSYWIVNCDKELIGGHGDIWSPAAMEMYAGFYRAIEARRPGDRR